MPAPRIDAGATQPGAAFSLVARRRLQVGEPLVATVTVEHASGSRVRFVTECRRAGGGARGGELVVEGAALALVPRRAARATSYSSYSAGAPLHNEQ